MYKYTVVWRSRQFIFQYSMSSLTSNQCSWLLGWYIDESFNSFLIFFFLLNKKFNWALVNIMSRSLFMAASTQLLVLFFNTAKCILILYKAYNEKCAYWCRTMLESELLKYCSCHQQCKKAHWLRLCYVTENRSDSYWIHGHFIELGDDN